MSRRKGEAKRLANSLATLVNSAMITKGAGCTISAQDMMPVAVILARIDADSRRAARVEKLLARNGKMLDALTAPDPTAPVRLAAMTDGADLIARIDRVLAPHAVPEGTARVPQINQ